MTKRIQSLERRLDTQLFERGRFGLRPTEAARLLYPEARQALHALQTAEDAVQPQGNPIVSLTASHTIGEFLLPGWLAAFRILAPTIRAKVDIVNSTGVLAHIRAGDADIGFVEGLDPLDRLDVLPLHQDQILAVVAHGHRWAHRRSLRVSELADEPYLAREAGSGTRAVATAILSNAGLELVPALEAASTQSLKRALNAGGFALLSELAVETERRAGTLSTLTLRGIELARELCAVRQPRRRLPRASQQFWDWLRQRSL